LANALVRLLAQSVGHAERRNCSRVDASGYLNALLPLVHGNRLAGLWTEDAVDFAVQEAALDQHALNNANIIGRKIGRRNTTATVTTTAETSSRTSRNHINNVAITVHEYNFILHNEETVVAIGREHVDQCRIS
jgi:hypothetical protein